MRRLTAPSAAAATALGPVVLGLVVLGLVVLGLVVVGTDGTRAGWGAGSTSATATTTSGTVAFTHSYPTVPGTTCSLGVRTGGTQTCTGSIAPTTAATSGGVSATDTLTNQGSLGAARLLAEVRVAACGPVQLADRVVPANPLLPRHGTTFRPDGSPGGASGGPMGGVGFLTLDGAAGTSGAGPGGYATSVVASTQPGAGLLSAGRLSGVGIWFKAATGTSGPLLSFGASPSDGSGSVDRALFLDAAGKLRLVWNTSGSSIGPTSSSYADGQWHFAYVTFGGVNVAILGLIPEVVLWVDGTQQASTPALSLAPLSSYSGYWHLGWAPTSVTGLTSAYAAVSLSNLVVLNTAGSVPSGATLGVPTTQAAFTTATAAATDHWILDDPGTTTFAGTLPATMTAPCGRVAVDWTLSGPASTVASAVPLSTLADGTWRTVAAPAAGASQTSTITLRRGVGHTADVAGLHLLAPVSYRVQTAPAGGAWSQTFTWSGAEAAFVS